MNLFNAALNRRNAGRPPVWFMRQAGRYHSHYQKLRARHGFMDLCKVPELATEVTFGPLDDFGFDAAILFSDLLFPLEALGMGLEYAPGPKLGWHLKERGQLSKLTVPRTAPGTRASFMEFQAEALRQIRRRLPAEKGLIGFVGGPFTLYCYAVDGSHQGGLEDSKAGLKDGRFAGFCESLEGMLADNMALQHRAGADVIAMMDTCAGEVDPQTYACYVVPATRRVLAEFKRQCPEAKVLYYSKKTDPAHLRELDGLPIDGLGVDWRHPIADILREFGGRYAIQGNFDPSDLHLPLAELEPRIRAFFKSVEGCDLSGWICGLGHGVLQHTPEESVRLFLRLQKEHFQ